MPKFTVYLMKPVLTWERVDAEDETHAIAQCESAPGVDICVDEESMQFIAAKEEDENNEKGVH